MLPLPPTRTVQYHHRVADVIIFSRSDFDSLGKLSQSMIDWLLLNQNCFFA